MFERLLLKERRRFGVFDQENRGRPVAAKQGKPLIGIDRFLDVEVKVVEIAREGTTDAFVLVDDGDGGVPAWLVFRPPAATGHAASIGTGDVSTVLGFVTQDASRIRE